MPEKKTDDVAAAQENVAGAFAELSDAALAAHDEQTETAVSGLAQSDAPDGAVAVKLSDLRDLVEHAVKTGAEELAARFPMFQ